MVFQQRYIAAVSRRHATDLIEAASGMKGQRGIVDRGQIDFASHRAAPVVGAPLFKAVVECASDAAAAV